MRIKTVVLPEPLGPRKGRNGKGQKLSLLILGDSAAAGVGVDHQDFALAGRLVDILSEKFCVVWKLEASTGVTTEQSINRMDKLSKCQFDVIVTSLGVNDVTSNVSLSRWTQLQNNLHEKCLKNLGAQLVLVTAVPPMGKFPALPQPLRWYLGKKSDQFNQSLKNCIHDKKKIKLLSIDMIDNISAMAEDGFHPGEETYKLWAKIVAEKINAELSN